MFRFQTIATNLSMFAIAAAIIGCDLTDESAQSTSVNKGIAANQSAVDTLSLTASLTADAGSANQSIVNEDSEPFSIEKFVASGAVLNSAADTPFFVFDRSPPPDDGNEDFPDDGDQSWGTMDKIRMPLDLFQLYPQLVAPIFGLHNNKQDREQFFAAHGHRFRCPNRRYMITIFEIHDRGSDYLIEVIVSCGSEECGPWVDGSCYEDWIADKSPQPSLVLDRRYQYRGFRQMFQINPPFLPEPPLPPDPPTGGSN